MAAAGVEPSLGRADWLDRIGCFLELHVEQGRDLVDRDAPVGLATEIWPHGRYRFDFTGDANHAGHDADGGPARPDAQLRDDRAGGRASRPGSPGSGPPSAASTWRPTAPTRSRRGSPPGWTPAATPRTTLVRLVAEIKRQGTERADRDGTRLEVTAESVSGAVAFDPAHALACAPGWPTAGATYR